jgi:hypothetical protein
MVNGQYTWDESHPGDFVDLEQFPAEMTVDDLAADHPLGVLHQTLLCRYLSSSRHRQLTQNKIRNAIFEYWASPLKRHAILDELREADQLTPAKRQANCSGTMERPSGQPLHFGRETRFAHHSAKRRLADPASAAPIPEAYGAGHFALRAPLRREGILLREIISRENAASGATVALHTYRMSDTDAAWFPLDIAVTVLAGTLKWIAERGLPQRASQPWPIRELEHELLEYLPLHSLYNDAWFEDACARILTARNAGHIRSGRAGDGIREMLSEVDVPAEVVGSLRSAQDGNLDAWSRLRAGGGSADDLVFILADIFANLAAVRTLDEAPQNLLRALNWAYVPVIPAHQPTGAALFQRFAGEQQYRGLLNLVGDLFRLFHLAPLAAAHKFADMETAAWLLLRERACRREQL